jgi:hypothetical protein
LQLNYDRSEGWLEGCMEGCKAMREREKCRQTDRHLLLYSSLGLKEAL